MDIIEALDVLKQVSIDNDFTIVIQGDHVFSIAPGSRQGNMLATLAEMRGSVARILAWVEELGRLS